MGKEHTTGITYVAFTLNTLGLHFCPTPSPFMYASAIGVISKTQTYPILLEFPNYGGLLNLGVPNSTSLMLC